MIQQRAILFYYVCLSEEVLAYVVDVYTSTPSVLCRTIVTKTFVP